MCDSSCFCSPSEEQQPSPLDYANYRCIRWEELCSACIARGVRIITFDTEMPTPSEPEVDGPCTTSNGLTGSQTSVPGPSDTVALSTGFVSPVTWANTYPMDEGPYTASSVPPPDIMEAPPSIMDTTPYGGAAPDTPPVGQDGAGDDFSISYRDVIAALEQSSIGTSRTTTVVNTNAVFNTNSDLDITDSVDIDNDQTHMDDHEMQM